MENGSIKAPAPNTGCLLGLTASAIPTDQSKFAERQQKQWKRAPVNSPSLEAYAALPHEMPSCTVIPLMPTPTLASWESQVVPFFVGVLFPAFILLKQTNDLLIQHGYVRPLAEREDSSGESGFTDCVIDALLDGELVNYTDLSQEWMTWFTVQLSLSGSISLT